MASQMRLPLPLLFESRRDPKDELAAIEHDTLELKAMIRELLEPAAERYGISHKEITSVINGYTDDMLSDLFHETKSRLQAEIEAHDPY